MTDKDSRPTIARIWRGRVPHEREFWMISYWESVEAMARFTGRDPTVIHHLDRDPEFLIEMPKAVQILRLPKSHGRMG